MQVGEPGKNTRGSSRQGVGRHPTWEHLGALLRVHRERLGLSQEDLAALVNPPLTVGTISNVERGRTRPYRQTVEALCAALALDDSESVAVLQAWRSMVSSASGLRSNGPSDASSAPGHTRLPRVPLSLIGREADVAFVAERVKSGVRLLTLVGPGGVGKTRLAQAVSDHVTSAFADGSAEIDLAPVSDPQQVLPTIGAALGTREVLADDKPIEQLGTLLGRKHFLLVLDNFEQVLAAAPAVVQLLSACPRLTVLVTSRAALRVRGEHEFPVLPLAVPNPDTADLPDVVSVPAVALFLERAVAVRPDFQLTPGNRLAVAMICARLDGLPLALELTAAALLLFTPESLLKRLDRRLTPLVDGPRDLPQRQQTLRATLAWSYDLLRPAEQRLFRRLSVFTGGCTLQTAEVVCAATDGPGSDNTLEFLYSLTAWSLLRCEDVDGEPRFRMLELVREYGRELLAASGEDDAVRRAHAERYAAVAEMAEPELRGPRHLLVMNMLKHEQDNVRSVLRWTIETGALSLGMRTAAAVWRFWWLRGQLTEGRAWLYELLAKAGPANADRVSLALRSKALNAAAGLAFGQADYAHAQLLYEESLEVGFAAQDSERTATALHNLGYLAAEQGDTARARSLSQESLTRALALGDQRLVAVTLANLGDVARQQGEFEEATALLDESLALARRLSDTQYIGVGLVNLGHVYRDEGAWRQATARYTEALQTYRSVGGGYTLGMATCFEGLASVSTATGQALRAARLLGAAAAVRESIGAPVSPAATAVLQRAISTARHSLGAQAFDAAWCEGLAMSLVAAADLAVEGVPADRARSATIHPVRRAAG